MWFFQITWLRLIFCVITGGSRVTRGHCYISSCSNSPLPGVFHTRLYCVFISSPSALDVLAQPLVCNIITTCIMYIAMVLWFSWSFLQISHPLQYSHTKHREQSHFLNLVGEMSQGDTDKIELISHHAELTTQVIFEGEVGLELGTRNVSVMVYVYHMPCRVNMVFQNTFQVTPSTFTLDQYWNG